jgi:hypothetical protein
VGRSFGDESVNKVFFFRFAAVKIYKILKLVVFCCCCNILFADFCEMEIVLLI